MKIRIAKTLEEALSLVVGGYVPFAGGTDLFVRIRANGSDPDLAGLERLNELKGVRSVGDCLEIGSCVTWSEVESNPLIHKHAPLLSLASGEIGGPAIRNMGTIGGNVCTASPAGDGLVALWAMGATVEIVSVNGERSVDLEDFVSGPGKIDLTSGELVRSIRVKKKTGWRSSYRKVGKRKSMAVSVGSLAALWRDNEGTICDIRMALGAMAPRPVRSLKAEKLLHGVSFEDRERFRVVGEHLRDEVFPIDDIRASSSYRQCLAVNLIESLRLSICQGSSAIQR